MNRTLFLLILVTILSCNQEISIHQKTIEDPQLLNDSAIKITLSSTDSTRIIRAIQILDKAIQIDSTYEIALANKASFLLRIGNKIEALKTFDKLVSINPKYPDYFVEKGLISESLEYHLKAQDMFNTAELLYQDIIDTCQSDKKERYMLNRAINLKYLNRNAEGDSILKNLKNQSTDLFYNETIDRFLNFTGKEMLDNMK